MEMVRPAIHAGDGLIAQYFTNTALAGRPAIDTIDDRPATSSHATALEQAGPPTVQCAVDRVSRCPAVRRAHAVSDVRRRCPLARRRPARRGQQRPARCTHSLEGAAPGSRAARDSHRIRAVPVASTSWNGRGLSREAASPRCRPGLCRSDAVGIRRPLPRARSTGGERRRGGRCCAAGVWCLVTFRLVLRERATPRRSGHYRTSGCGAVVTTVVLMVLLLPWPGGGLWRAVFLTVRDNQVPALRQLLELSQFQANIATPGAGEHVLPPEVRTMVRLLERDALYALPPVPAACGHTPFSRSRWSRPRGRAGSKRQQTRCSFSMPSRFRLAAR